MCLMDIADLTDVTPDTASFAVQPRTHFDRTQPPGPDTDGLQLHGPVGTCIFYSTDLVHCRWDGVGRRRTMQQYYYASDRQHAQIDWVLVPPSLANLEFYSLWTSSQKRWAATGYSPGERAPPELIERFGSHRGNGGLTFPKVLTAGGLSGAPTVPGNLSPTGLLRSPR